jgi:putative FmdB family regulatory protein
MAVTRLIEGVGTMPIYEYKCAEGHRFEVTQTFSDLPITSCQACTKPVSKVISAPAIMFKGSGWYITDYSDKLKPTVSEPNPESTTGLKKDGAETKATNATSPPSASVPTPSPVSAVSPTGLNH